MVMVSFYTREPPEDVYFFLYTFHTFLRISYLMCFPLHVQTFSNIRPRHVSPASCSQRTCLAKVSLILRARIDDAVAARHGARERSWPKEPKDSGGPRQCGTLAPNAGRAAGLGLAHRAAQGLNTEWQVRSAIEPSCLKGAPARNCVAATCQCLKGSELI